MHHSSMAGLPFDWFGFSNFSTNRNIFFVWSKTIQLNWRPLWQVLSLSTIMQCDQRGHFGRISKVFGFFERLFSIWHIFEPTREIFSAIGPIDVVVVNGQILDE